MPSTLAVLKVARAAQAEAERHARLAALSAEERELHELRQWFEQDRAARNLKPGGRVVYRLNELFRKADSWPPSACHALAGLAEEIFGDRAIGWGSGDKKRERKSRINALRAKA